MNEEMVMTIKPDSYSVKTTTDITERIQELLKKTGLNHKDLFTAMVTRYYSELEAGSELDQSDDMQQIRYHLNRVENIFLGSLQKVQDLKKGYSDRLEDIKAKNKGVQEELQQLKNMHSKEVDELKGAKADAEQQQKITLDRNLELEEASRTSRMSIDLLSQKVRELESKLEASERLQEEMVVLKEQLSLVQQERDNLQVELSTEQQVISKLEDQLIEAEALAQRQLQKYQESAQKELAQLQKAAEKDILQLKELHALEKDKLLIEADRKVLEELKSVQAIYEQKTEKLLSRNEALTTKNQELTEKLYTLELELRKIHEV